MTPAEAFAQLAPHRQWRVQLALCGDALEVWTRYARTHAPIRYADSVVGMQHALDVALPADALCSAGAGEDLAHVARRYEEPITALQDDDLTFPREIKFAYYAIYNCFLKHACNEPIDPWVIVNQALSSNNNEASWTPRLTRAIAEAT